MLGHGTGSWWRGQWLGGDSRLQQMMTRSLQAKWIGDFSDFPLRALEFLSLIKRGRQYHTAHCGAGPGQSHGTTQWFLLSGLTRCCSLGLSSSSGRRQTTGCMSWCQKTAAHLPVWNKPSSLIAFNFEEIPDGDIRCCGQGLGAETVLKGEISFKALVESYQTLWTLRKHLQFRVRYLVAVIRFSLFWISQESLKITN